LNPEHEPLYRVELLREDHEREQFSCGVAGVDAYLHAQALEDMRSKSCAVFVLVPVRAPADVLGYFTLCARGLAQGTIRKGARKHLPRYPEVSAIVIERLAIKKMIQRTRTGEMLLAMALAKAHENAALVGAPMVLAEALDENGTAFYVEHGFVKLPDSMRLVISMRSIELSMRSAAR